MKNLGRSDYIMSVDPLNKKNVDAEPGTLWHTLTIKESFERLNSGPSGLTAAEAARRLDEFGPNELQATARVSPWMILFEQFKNVLIVILLGATALSAFLGHGIEAIAIIRARRGFPG